MFCKADFLRLISNQDSGLITPHVLSTVTETADFLAKNKGVEDVAKFLDSLSVTKFQLETPTAENYRRAAEILRKYNDANIDFVDSCIVAIAERLNVTKILTVDRRHFEIFKPSHCKAFEILP